MSGRFNPFRTAVPFRGATTQIISSLSQKRDCGTKRVSLASSSKGEPNPLLAAFFKCLIHSFPGPLWCDPRHQPPSSPDVSSSPVAGGSYPRACGKPRRKHRYNTSNSPPHFLCTCTSSRSSLHTRSARPRAIVDPDNGSNS